MQQSSKGNARITNRVKAAMVFYQRYAYTSKEFMDHDIAVEV
jgi:hypothetical protein